MAEDCSFSSNPIEMINRVHDYWKEHEEEIQAAERYDGSNYILKALYRALNFNSMAANTTVTVSSAMNREAERRRQHALEVSRDCIVAAICEVIDSDFESRIEAAEDSERYWRDECYGDEEKEFEAVTSNDWEVVPANENTTAEENGE